MVQTVAILLVLIYFIYTQFTYSDVKRLNYFLIPLFSLFQFFNQVTWTGDHYVEFWVIFIASLIIGFYQAFYTHIREGKKVTSYFVDQGHKHAIYTKVVQAKGGYHYLIGWVLALVLQFVIAYLISPHHLTSSSIFIEIFKDALTDLSLAFRIFNSTNNSWYVWAITGFTSISYTLFLSYFSPSFRKKLFKGDSYFDLVKEVR